MVLVCASKRGTVKLGLYEKPLSVLFCVLNCLDFEPNAFTSGLGSFILFYFTSHLRAHASLLLRVIKELVSTWSGKTACGEHDTGLGH
eukprot:1982745-Amphidinium_carterae.1